MEREITITTRDRLLRGWQNAAELVRDYENYSQEIADDREAADLFGKLAEQEGRSAAALHQLLRRYEEN